MHEKPVPLIVKMFRNGNYLSDDWINFGLIMTIARRYCDQKQLDTKQQSEDCIKENSYTIVVIINNVASTNLKNSQFEEVTCFPGEWSHISGHSVS